MAVQKELAVPERETLANWQVIGELLNTGQYEQTVELLNQIRALNEEAGNKVLVSILAAICTICLAGIQYQAEMNWYQQAYEEAHKREQNLKQQLHLIIDLLSQVEVALPREKSLDGILPAGEANQPEPGLPQPDPLNSLWQRIRSLLSWPAPLPAPGTVPGPAASAGATASPLPEYTPPTSPVVHSSTSAVLAIHCLGPFRVYQNGQLLTGWNSLKAQSILKYLVLHPGNPVNKDILMEVFWPEADLESARRNLHQAVYSLRQSLRHGQVNFQPIQFENDHYLLNPDLNIWLDFQQFEQLVQVGQRFENAGHLAEAVAEYEQADRLYQGDLLEDDLYEDWITVKREHLRTIYLDLADRLSYCYLQLGEYAAAIEVCQKVLAKDNCYEKAHCRLMECYQLQGQLPLAVRQYQFCVRALKTELDVPPSTETQALFERIVRGGRSFVLAG